MPEEGTDTAEAALPSFIELLVPDPGELPDLKVVIGLPGRSLQDELLRLYQSLALDTYVEVRREDIVHSQRLDPLLREAAIVWLNGDAQIVHGPARAPGPRDGE